MKKLNVVLVSLVMCGSLYGADSKALEKGNHGNAAKKSTHELAAEPAGIQTEDITQCFQGLKSWADEFHRVVGILTEGGKDLGIGLINGSGKVWERTPALKDVLPNSGDPYDQLDNDQAFNSIKK